jgi:hypothetical protein
MKKYLFFCFGEFKQSSVDNILTQVSRYSDKDKMLYQNGNGHLIVHMFSNDSLNSLRNKLFESLSNVTKCQFLFEDDQYYDNMLVNLRDLFGVDNKEQSLTDYLISQITPKIELSPEVLNIHKKYEKKIEDFLKSSNQDDKKEEIKEDYGFIKKLDDVIKDFIDNNKLEDADVSFECDDEDNDEDTLITTTVKKEYFVDEILDKISEKGVSSLTQDELNFLNSFSK